MSKFDNYNLNTEYKQRELDMLPQTGTTTAAAAVEVCPLCDIAGCRHIRERNASASPVQGPIAASPCRCRSYNQPDLGGDVGEIVVTMPAHLRDRMGRSEEATTVCLDLCIAPLVLAMWAAGIPTLGSCCGHNNPEWHRDVIVHPEDRAAAAAVVIGLNDNARIGTWEGDTLVWSESTHTDTQEIARLRKHADRGWALYTHWGGRYFDCATERDRLCSARDDDGMQIMQLNARTDRAEAERDMWKGASKRWKEAALLSEARIAEVEAEHDDLAKSLHAEMGARDDALVRAEKAEAERDAEKALADRLYKAYNAVNEALGCQHSVSLATYRKARGI